MKKVCIIMILACMGCSPGKQWTKQDTYRHATLTGLMVIDWQQTREIAENPDKYWEINPLVGKHPSVGKVDRYFVSSWLIKTGVAWAFPKYRTKWQWFCIGVSASLVGHNFRIGLKGEW